MAVEHLEVEIGSQWPLFSRSSLHNYPHRLCSQGCNCFMLRGELRQFTHNTCDLEFSASGQGELAVAAECEGCKDGKQKGEEGNDERRPVGSGDIEARGDDRIDEDRAG